MICSACCSDSPQRHPLYGLFSLWPASSLRGRIHSLHGRIRSLHGRLCLAAQSLGIEIFGLPLYYPDSTEWRSLEQDGGIPVCKLRCGEGVAMQIG